MILAAINTILNSSADLKAYTGEQIYAVNIDQDVKGNMVVFNSETLPEDTKGGNAMDVDMLVIACVSPTYRTAAMITKPYVEFWHLHQVYRIPHPSESSVQMWKALPVNMMRYIKNIHI